MNGDIGIDSEPGKGSSFWIRIPQQHNKLEALLQSPNGFHSKKALILSNVPQETTYIQTWLEQWNVAVNVIPELTTTLTFEEISSEGYDYIFADSKQLEKNLDLIINISAPNSTPIVSIEELTSEGYVPVPEEITTRIDAPLRLRQLKAAIGGESVAHKIINQEEDPNLNWANDLSSYSVLLVDDNPINRLVTTKLLSQKHLLTADKACDGIEALELLKSQKYDLVLMDCMMPEMDGYDATKAIRSGVAGPLNQKVPIIALTANAMEGDRKKCINAGMDDHLSKPIQPQALKRLLAAWIDGRS